MPVTRSQTRRTLKQAGQSSQPTGSPHSSSGSSNPGTPQLDQAEQQHLGEIMDLLAPDPNEDMPDDFRRLRIEVLHVLNRFINHDRSLFHALQAKAPLSHVRIDKLRRHVAHTLSDADDMTESEGAEPQFEQQVLRSIGQFEEIREAQPDDFSLARLIVCALVDTLDKIIDMASPTIAHFEVRERLKTRLCSEIYESPNDVVMPHLDDIVEIIDKLESKDGNGSADAETKRLLSKKVTNVRNVRQG